MTKPERSLSDGENEITPEILNELKRTEVEEATMKGKVAGAQADGLGRPSVSQGLRPEKIPDNNDEQNSAGGPEGKPQHSRVGGEPSENDEESSKELDVPDTEEDTDYESDQDWKATHEYRLQSIKVENKNQNMLLRNKIASFAIAIVSIQIFVANVYFLIYLLTNLEDTDSNVMIAWLSATVIEVIGIMLVVARSLFKPDRKNSSKDEKVS